MKTFLTVSLFFVSLIAFGQIEFVVVQDKDGHCNVRSSTDAGNNVTDTLKNGRLVFWENTQGNWSYIYYRRGNKELYGYVYNDRLKKLSAYQDIPVNSNNGNMVTLRKDSIKIILAEQKFDKRKYKLTYYKESDDQIELINGKPYWGTDGSMPRTEYKSVTIQHGKRIINLPRTALANLFEPNLSTTTVNYDSANDIFYIQSMNSDAAGAYYLVWKIEKGVYTQRQMAGGN